jgi:hypothetical protein
LIKSCAETRGIPPFAVVRSTTITRRPFFKVVSDGVGRTGERGDAGGGGVSCCARADVNERLMSEPTRDTARIARLKCFIAFIIIFSSYAEVSR